MSFFNTTYGYYNSRLKRGMKQKMFLLNAKYDNPKNEWIFTVKGTTNDYTLIINETEICCTCPDFTGRGRICKHIYFIIGRIGQNENMIYELEEAIENGERGSALTKEEFNTLHNNLHDRLTQRINQLSKTSNPKLINTLEDDCSICFESLKEYPVLQCEKSCKNHFHEDCITTWLNKNTTCPFCREPWQIKRKPSEDEFDPLNKLNIKKTKLK